MTHDFNDDRETQGQYAANKAVRGIAFSGNRIERFDDARFTRVQCLEAALRLGLGDTHNTLEAAKAFEAYLNGSVEAA